jgi:hypothetical protein
MVSNKFTRSIAIGIAAISIAVGSVAFVNTTSTNVSAGVAGSNQTVVGQVPQGWQSGSGTIITGAAADHATAVAVAAYPGGTVNRVLQLADSSYAVHQINISWPHHVFVSTDFQVTGAIG